MISLGLQEAEGLLVLRHGSGGLGVATSGLLMAFGSSPLAFQRGRMALEAIQKRRGRHEKPSKSNGKP